MKLTPELKLQIYIIGVIILTLAAGILNRYFKFLTHTVLRDDEDAVATLILILAAIGFWPLTLVLAITGGLCAILYYIFVPKG